MTAQGGASAAGIGGPTNAAAGTIVINDGVVTATGGTGGAGIGAGRGGSPRSVRSRRPPPGHPTDQTSYR